MDDPDQCLICHEECNAENPCIDIHAVEVGVAPHRAHFKCIQGWLVINIRKRQPYECPLCRKLLTERDVKQLPWPTIRVIFNGTIVAIEGYILQRLVGLHNDMGDFVHGPRARDEMWRFSGMFLAVLLFGVITNVLTVIAEGRGHKGRSRDPRNYRGGGEHENILSVEIVGNTNPIFSEKIPEEYMEILTIAIERLKTVLEMVEMEGTSLHTKGATRARRRNLIVGGKSTRRRRRR